MSAVPAAVGKLLPNKITAWSYSRLSVFRKCKFQFYLKFIAKHPVKEDEGPALVHGRAVDELLQQYVAGNTKKLPIDLKKTMGKDLVDSVALLRKVSAHTQLEIAVDRNWQRVDWFSQQAWLRAKLDAAAVGPSKLNVSAGGVLIVDYKTGKVYEAPHTEQLEIYVAIGPSMWPDATEFNAQMWYVDQGLRSAPMLVENDGKRVERLRKKWTAIAAPIFTEKKFKPTPGMECRWCVFSGRRGGPCKAG
jgi:RecB family exonuclease